MGHMCVREEVVTALPAVFMRARRTLAQVLHVRAHLARPWMARSPAARTAASTSSSGYAWKSTVSPLISARSHSLASVMSFWLGPADVVPASLAVCRPRIGSGHKAAQAGESGITDQQGKHDHATRAQPFSGDAARLGLHACHVRVADAQLSCQHPTPRKEQQRIIPVIPRQDDYTNDRSPCMSPRGRDDVSY